MTTTDDAAAKESAVQRAKRVTADARTRGEAAWDHVQNDVRPNNRAALCTMASKTGCVSVGEPLMTFRISAVAV